MNANFNKKQQRPLVPNPLVFSLVQEKDFELSMNSSTTNRLEYIISDDNVNQEGVEAQPQTQTLTQLTESIHRDKRLKTDYIGDNWSSGSGSSNSSDSTINVIDRQKLMVIGLSGSGKTSVIDWIIHNNLVTQECGTDFLKIRSTTLLRDKQLDNTKPDNNNNTKLSLSIWEHPTSKNVLPYAFPIFSLTSPLMLVVKPLAWLSNNGLFEYLELIKLLCGATNLGLMKIFVVVTFADVKEDDLYLHKQTRDKILTWSKNNGVSIPSFSVSTKTGLGMKTLVSYIKQLSPVSITGNLLQHYIIVIKKICDYKTGGIVSITRDELIVDMERAYDNILPAQISDVLKYLHDCGEIFIYDINPTNDPIIILNVQELVEVIHKLREGYGTRCNVTRSDLSTICPHGKAHVDRYIEALIELCYIKPIAIAAYKTDIRFALRQSFVVDQFIKNYFDRDGNLVPQAIEAIMSEIKVEADFIDRKSKVPPICVRIIRFPDHRVLSLILECLILHLKEHYTNVVRSYYGKLVDIKYGYDTVKLLFMSDKDITIIGINQLWPNKFLNSVTSIITKWLSTMINSRLFTCSSSCHKCALKGKFSRSEWPADKFLVLQGRVKNIHGYKIECGNCLESISPEYIIWNQS